MVEVGDVVVVTAEIYDQYYEETGLGRDPDMVNYLGKTGTVIEIEPYKLSGRSLLFRSSAFV